MIHRSIWREVLIYFLVIVGVMLALAYFLTRPVCWADVGCVSKGVLTAAVLLIVLITSSALLNARHRTKSIRELDEMARQISAGDTTIRILPHAGDEIGDLARDITRMTDKLRDQINDLSEQNQQLEIVLVV